MVQVGARARSVLVLGGLSLLPGSSEREEFVEADAVLVVATALSSS